MSEGGRFLARWLRLKKAAGEAAPALPDLPDAEALLAGLGPDSDFGLFLRQEVSEAVRRQAMKTLFADPHFNVMDGLDTYIDDYSVSEPIPEAMLATLNQARGLFTQPGEEEAEPGQEMEKRDILTEAGQDVPSSATPSGGAVTGNQ